MEAADGEETVGPLTVLPREAPTGSYADRRDRMIEATREQGSGCTACVEFVASLLVTGGALERFRHVCRVRKREDRRAKLYEKENHPLAGKLRSEEGYLLRVWRRLQIWRGRYEGGFSMKGRGGRRQEFEEWCGGELSEGSPGRPGLLETTHGPEPDVCACLDDLETWARHLADFADPTEHVEWLDPEKEGVSWGEPPLPPEYRRIEELARQVKQYLDDRAERVSNHERGRRPELAPLARRMLSELSDGLLEEGQIRDLARRESRS